MTLKFLYFSTLIITVVPILLSCTQRCTSGSDDEIVQCLSRLPKEEIRQIPKVKKYLAKHKVYVSLTTSPTRLPKILPVLRSIDLELVENIFLALPDRYRNTEGYKIPQEIIDFPKLKVLQGGTDLGPIMKLLPAIKQVKASDPDAIVITVDDDTGYSANIFSQLVKYAILNNSVVGFRGTNVESYEINGGQYWPEKHHRAPSCYSGSVISYCDMVEGYGAIAYRARFVDTELMSKLSQVNKWCKTSDDLVINYVLATRGIPRALLTGVKEAYVIQFAYGFGADALHQGSGLSAPAKASNANAEKYQKCLVSLVAGAFAH